MLILFPEPGPGGVLILLRNARLQRRVVTRSCPQVSRNFLAGAFKAEPMWEILPVAKCPFQVRTVRT
jgi:hypothetical protein